jgi:hypothetical protein
MIQAFKLQIDLEYVSASNSHCMQLLHAEMCATFNTQRPG